MTNGDGFGGKPDLRKRLPQLIIRKFGIVETDRHLLPRCTGVDLGNAADPF
jgi:hypothetical protein